jgi:hypothetical protein
LHIDIGWKSLGKRHLSLGNEPRKSGENLENQNGEERLKSHGNKGVGP